MKLSIAALCSVQAQLAHGLGNIFESKCIKSPRCPENMGQFIVWESVQVKLQLPQVLQFCLFMSAAVANAG